MNKSKDLIPIVIAANDKESAIQALRLTVQALYLEEDELHLISLKDKLEEYKQELRDIMERVKTLDYSQDSEEAQELRIECNFLHIRATDDLAFKINQAKIYNEERRSVYKKMGEGEIKENDTLLNELKNKRGEVVKKDLESAVYTTQVFQRYTTRYSLAYGLFIESRLFFEGINNLSNSLASITRHRQEIEKKDQK